VCGFCGAADPLADWSLAPAVRRAGDALDRAQLAAAAHELLAPLGFSVRAWAGRFIVATPTGGAAIVSDFAAVFAVVTRRRGGRG